MVGQYRLDATANDLAQLPNSITSTNIGGNAIDSQAGIIYGQIITASASSTTTSSGSSSSAPAAPAAPPVLSIMDAENLPVRQSFSIPENITGRSVLSAAADMLYTVSDSGVMIFPVGRLNQQHRLSASVRDVVARGTFCNRSVITQTLTMTDPGGGNTDFELSSNTAGRHPFALFRNYSGHRAGARRSHGFPEPERHRGPSPFSVNSAAAVNVPPPVRLLINNRNPDQRGTFVDIPGYLTDILADPVRNRFYIVRQDINQVLVFDSTTYTQIASLNAHPPRPPRLPSPSTAST